MGLVENLGNRMKKTLTKLTPADYAAAVTKAEGLLAECTQQVNRAKVELNASIDTLMDEGQELEIKRLRRLIAIAEQNERDSAADLACHRSRFERSRVADQDAAHAQLRSEVERVGQLLYQRAQLIRDASETLAAKIDEFAIVANELQKKSDELLVSERERTMTKAKDAAQLQSARRLLTRVTVHDFNVLFHSSDVMHLIALDLSVFTAGKWAHRGYADMYAVAQGPRFDDRVREGVRMLLRALPKIPTDSPPPAA